MQLDAKARIEGALHHALAVYFEYARGGEAAHQRRTHLGGVRPHPGGKEQRLAHRLDVERNDDLVRHFAGLAVTVATYQRHVLAHEIEKRLHLFERVFRAAHHDRERGRLGPDFAAGHRRVQVLAAERFDLLRESLGVDRRDGTHVDHDLAFGEPARDAILAEQHRCNVRRVGHHADDDVRLLRHCLRRVAFNRALISETLGRRLNIVDAEFVTARAQVPRHRGAHDAKTDETNLAHALLLTDRYSS